MLQLKHIRALAEMSGVKYSEITPHQFGSNGTFDGSTFVAASALVPHNSSLVILRVQCYMINEDNTASDYCFYRSFPPLQADWELSDTAGASSYVWATAYLDTDVLLIFPSNKYAVLVVTPTALPPATGTWTIRTVVFGYFVPARVTDALAGTQALTTG